MKKLYIDDLREMPAGFTTCAQTFDKALALIEAQDWDEISFDHDLGELEVRRNGLTLMNRLEELVMLGERKAPFVKIHSANSGAWPAMAACRDKINGLGC